MKVYRTYIQRLITAGKIDLLVCLLAVLNISCSPISSFLAVGSSIAPTTVPISKSNLELLTVQAQLPPASLGGFVWLEDGRVAAASDQGVMFLALPAAKTLTQPSVMRSAEPQVAALQPLNLTAAQAKYIAWSAADLAVHVWGVAENQEIYRLGDDELQYTSLVFSPEADQLAASTFDNKVLVWEMAAGKSLGTWQTAGWLANLSYSPDGKLLGGAELEKFKVHIYELATGKELIALQWVNGVSPVLYGAYFSSDWTWLAWVARETVQLMRVPGGEVGPVLNHEDFISAIAWSPHSDLLASAAAGTINGEFLPAIFLWEPVSGQLLRTIPLNESVTSLAFSPDGASLAVLTVRGGLDILAIR